MVKEIWIAFLFQFMWFRFENTDSISNSIFLETGPNGFSRPFRWVANQYIKRSMIHYIQSSMDKTSKQNIENIYFLNWTFARMNSLTNLIVNHFVSVWLRITNKIVSMNMFNLICSICELPESDHNKNSNFFVVDLNNTHRTAF